MDATYWPLLPADESIKANRRSRKSPSDDSDNGRRRVVTKVACNPCRTKKAACDGARPTCTLCTKRGRRCNYLSKHEQETPLMVLKRQNDDLQSEAGELVELLACFKYASTDVSLDILMRLRTGEDPLDVLAGLKNAPPESSVREDMDTVLRVRGQELEFTEMDEEMFPMLDVECLEDGLEDGAISPERWLEGESDSPDSAQNGSQSDSPDSTQNFSLSSPSDPSSSESPPYDVESCVEDPESCLPGRSETVLLWPGITTACLCHRRTHSSRND